MIMFGYIYTTPTPHVIKYDFYAQILPFATSFSSCPHQNGAARQLVFLSILPLLHSDWTKCHVVPSLMHIGQHTAQRLWRGESTEFSQLLRASQIREINFFYGQFRSFWRISHCSKYKSELNRWIKPTEWSPRDLKANLVVRI